MNATDRSFTKRLLLDASAVINLHEGGVLNVILRLPGSRFTIGVVVQREIQHAKEAMEELVELGAILTDDGGSVSALTFLDLQRREGIGPGEAECIVHLEKDASAIMVSDDKRARTCATRRVGKDRVTGSLGLLREAVAYQLIVPKAAFEAYLAMKAAGAFLPDVADETFFSGAAQAQTP